MDHEKHILFCILDWGFGHATRSTPIIQLLNSKGYKLTIATSKVLYEQYVKKEFKDVSFYELKAYQPKYAKGKRQVLKLIKQVPRFLIVYLSDKRRVNKIARMRHVDVIFSDGRFSCRSRRIRSVYISHQLNILKTGSLSKWGMASKLHQWIIRKFDICLVPDDKNGVFGKLTHNEKLGNKIRYIGYLSRYRGFELKRSRKYILAILSGPEPQRSLLEEKILNSATHIKEKLILVRGSEKVLRHDIPENVRVYNIVQSPVLIKLLQDCSYVISRSGYSSIMDLLVLNQHAIVIPTPGQSEQEYIASVCHKKHWFVVQDQQSLKILKPGDVYSWCKLPDSNPSLVQQALSDLI